MRGRLRHGGSSERQNYRLTRGALFSRDLAALAAAHRLRNGVTVGNKQLLFLSAIR
jgi:hypothetical protein